MRNLDRIRREIRILKSKLRAGDSTASNNIAAMYREIGNYRRAFYWWQRTAGPHHGEAWLEVGYCLQYGIGVRLNSAAAIRAYRQAIKTYYITEFATEEAQYHLAVAILDRRAGSRHVREAKRLLRQAAEDGDYPQASDLLNQLDQTSNSQICRCRRQLRRSLGGKAQCELHRK